MFEQDGSLYHFSEDPSIRRFEPRFSELISDTVVWAVDPAHTYLYLFPRDCPRVTFYATSETTEADRQRFLGLSTAPRVVAIEADWLIRLRETRLYRYELPADSFELHDATAGYWLSHATVEARGLEVVDDLLRALTSQGVEVRILPSLWPLYEAVIASTLGFSIIRWRNAASRPMSQEESR